MTTKVSVQKKGITRGDYFITIQTRKLNNSLWKDVFRSWRLIQQKQITTGKIELIRVNIWHNSKITADRKSILNEYYLKNGVIFIKDLNGRSRSIFKV